MSHYILFHPTSYPRERRIEATDWHVGTRGSPLYRIMILLSLRALAI